VTRKDYKRRLEEAIVAERDWYSLEETTSDCERVEETCPQCQTPRGSASGFQAHEDSCKSSLPPIPLEYLEVYVNGLHFLQLIGSEN